MNYITNIQKYSIHDGDGIRTTVFFKGCPLKCVWCHNPETQRFERELQYDKEKCIGCGACAKVCPQEIIHIHECANYIVVKCSNKSKGAAAKKQCEVSCIGCGICEKTCTAGAIRVTENHAVINEELCLSCGMCAVKCPQHAIYDLRGIYTEVK